jgi:hypothetical protein
MTNTSTNTHYSSADAEGFLVSAVRTEAELLLELARSFSDGRSVSEKVGLIIYILDMLRLASDEASGRSNALH